MAWETRNGNRYYYAKLRIGGKVKSIYLGTSPLAHQTAQRIQLARSTRTQTQEQDHEWQNLATEIESLRAQIEALLDQAGLHRQNYGPWRRKTPRPSVPPA